MSVVWPNTSAIQKSMFISYNWAQAKLADEIEMNISPYINIVRDKNIVGNWVSLSEFMKRIRKEDFAVLLISDEYLTSINCMYEVSQLVKDDDWVNRVMLFVIDNAISIYDPLKRSTYLKYWENYRHNLEESLNGIPSI